MDAARLERLLDRYLDEALTDDEKTELEQMLRAEPEARQAFWKHARFHALLRESGAEGRGRELAMLAEEPRRNWWRALAGSLEAWKPGFGGAVAAVAVLIVILGLWFARLQFFAPKDQMTNGVAVLAQAIDVEWAPGSEAYSPGASLPPGWLRFKSGLAQVEFSDGARLLVEGPAEVQVMSRGEAFCRSGRMSVQVPPTARGFRVTSPQMTIVDLGTAFGFEAKDGAAELHVFEGKVRIADSRGAPKQELAAGRALGVDASGKWREFEAVALRFPNADIFERKAASAWERRSQVWRDAADKLHKDASVILFYTFQNASPFDRHLHNEVSGADRASDGAIVGCRWAEGRWPGKSALEFKGTGDRVRLEVPGVFDALTLAAWVRVDSLDHSFNSLLMADAFDRGGMHWQITKSGMVKLGLSGGGDFDTAVIFTPERLGQWIHLAVVIDRNGHTVTHYVDGHAVSTRALKIEVPLGFGRAEVGNWNPVKRPDRTPIRTFNGRMDEMLVFRRALDAQEVRSLARNGPTSQPVSP